MTVKSPQQVEFCTDLVWSDGCLV